MKWQVTLFWRHHRNNYCDWLINQSFMEILQFLLKSQNMVFNGSLSCFSALFDFVETCIFISLSALNSFIYDIPISLLYYNNANQKFLLILLKLLHIHLDFFFNFNFQQQNLTLVFKLHESLRFWLGYLCMQAFLSIKYS